ncbi:MAG: hypothetical protein H0S82_02585, partial [Anaerolineaceae bacterium]|nr:hypothetical protein [Anaerolineaceae bacterium]
MFKNRSVIFIQFVLIVGIIFSLQGQPNQVAAATACTWEGWVDTDWYNALNWDGCYDGSANPIHPGTDDIVEIGAGKARYPWLTLYQGAIAVNTLTIEAGGQITVDNYTTITANQFDNYGQITIQNVSGHVLRINSPFNNYGTVSFGTEPTLILYLSGTHTGSFSGKQLSFNNAGSTPVNTFQSSSTVNVNTLYVGENQTVNFAGNVSADRAYIRSGASINVTNPSAVNIAEIILQGGEFITDSYTVASGDSFSGSGTIEANLINSGTVSPGSSPGTITVTGDYTQQADGTLTIELGGTTPDTEHDQLAVSGAVTLGGALNVTLINEFSPELGDSFTIMTYGSVSGSFASASLPTLAPGLKWG